MGSAVLAATFLHLKLNSSCMPFLLFNSDALVIFAFFSKTVGMIVGQKLENVHSSDNFNQHPMLLQLVQNTEAVFAKNI